MYNCHRFSLVTTELAASKSSNAKKMRPWRSSTLTLLGSFRKAALPQTPKNGRNKNRQLLGKAGHIYINMDQNLAWQGSQCHNEIQWVSLQTYKAGSSSITSSKNTLKKSEICEGCNPSTPVATSPASYMLLHGSSGALMLRLSFAEWAEIHVILWLCHSRPPKVRKHQNQTLQLTKSTWFLIAAV